MSEATLDIGVRVNMADAAKLEALPKSVRERWEEVSKVLSGVSGLTDLARERAIRGTERMADLMGKADIQGGFTPAQRKAFEQNFKETTRIIDRGLSEQIATAKTKGQQLEQELASLGERLARVKGREKEILQKSFTEQFKAFGEFEAQGGNRAQINAARAARNQFRAARNDVEDLAALLPTVPSGTRAPSSFIGPMPFIGPPAPTPFVGPMPFIGPPAPPPFVGPPAPFIGPMPFVGPPAPTAAKLGATVGAAAGTATGTAAATGATAAIGAAAKAGAAAGTTAGAAAGARVAAGFGGSAGFPGAGGFGPPLPPAGGYPGAGGPYPGGAYSFGNVGYGASPGPGQPPPQPPSQGPGGPNAGGGAGGAAGPGGAMGATGFLKNFGRGLIGASVIGGGGYLAASMLRRQFSDELERGMRVSDLAQRLKPAGMGYEQFRDQVGEINKSFTPDESTRFVERFGESGTRNLFAQRPGMGGSARQAAEMTRRLGLTPEEGAQQFGQAERLGLGGSEQAQKKLAELIGEAVAQGQMNGRQGEVFDSILRLGESVASRTGTAMEVGPIAGLLARLAETGAPGLKGAMGASVVERIDSSLSGAQILKAFPPALIQAAVRQTFPNASLAKTDEYMEGGLSKFPEEMGRVIKTMLDIAGDTENSRAMIAKTLNIPLGVRDQVFAAATTGGGPTAMKDALAPASGTPEAKIREDIADLRRQEAALVRDLIPAYQKLIQSAVGATEFFKKDPSIQGTIATGKGALQTLHSGTQEAIKNIQEGKVDASGAWESAKDVGAGLWDVGKQLWAAMGPAATQQMLDTATGKGSLPESELNALSQRGARVSGLPPALIRSTIQQESRGDPNAVSKAGAQGLMQLMPSSFPKLSDAERFDPATNVETGSKYLREQIDRFGGDIKLGLAAYNSGAGAVQKYHGIPPFQETQDYVSKVTTDYDRRMGAERNFLPQESAANAKSAKASLNITADPVQLFLRNEKGEVVASTQVPLKVGPLSGLDLSTSPGGTGMHAATGSSVFGSYQ